MVGVMILASHWQWSRLQETKRANAQTTSAMNDAPTVLTSASQLDPLGKYRRVSVSGTWDFTHSVYVRYPVVDSAQGYYALTPLKVSDGSTVVVNRGWFPQQAAQDDAMPAANTQPVTVTGLTREGDDESGSVEATTGSPSIPTVTAIDAKALAPLMKADVPVNWIQLEQPVVPSGPKVLPQPELTEGSHWSYTLQWAAFAIITVLGYGVLLRKAEKEDRLDSEESPAGL